MNAQVGDVDWTAAALIAFEREVAAAFNAGRVRAPVHLAGGAEEPLIKIFRRVAPEDWVFTTWRSHYHCLLKGVPADRVMADVLAGRSITLVYPEHRVYSSAIVAGAVPAAVGVAMSISRSRQPGRVWVFVGDMAARAGLFSECVQYAEGHRLPVRVMVEDNGRSVCTDTAAAWGGVRPWWCSSPLVETYEYVLPWPHAGAGVRVQF